MSSRRAPAPAPHIPGFTYVSVLGSGGFADVYLYEQELPRRRVAIKVLLPDRMESSATQFASEANVMAMLSSHPAIVTIYQAGVSSDGRPYLVMEYCPGANLQARYRREPLSVAETLRIGIPVAAAVETAHRAGVLHRDIKPANVLTTQYNRPSLTDFGIAATGVSGSDAAGMSIPWSPPEAFGEISRSGPRSDVYQLGATLYTLLAGRSPFEVSGMSNASADMIDRIERMPVPRLTRPDVPESLRAVLERSMAKRPEDRQDSALAFARALQKVQIELDQAVTAIDIIDDNSVSDVEEGDEGEHTRVRGVASIVPDAAPEPVLDLDSPTMVRRPPMIDAETALPGSGVAIIDDSTLTGPGPAPWANSAPPPATLHPIDPDAPTSRGGRITWIISACVVGAAVIGVVALGLPALLNPPAPETSSGPTTGPVGPLVSVPDVEDVSAVLRGDDVTFTWTNPKPQDGDTYMWRIATIDDTGTFERVEDPTVTVPAQSGDTCIEVMIRRANGQSSEQPVAFCLSDAE